MAPSPHALVLDADNTLWNTNAVFKRAGAQMMRALAEDAAGEEVGADAPSRKEDAPSREEDAPSREEGASEPEKHRDHADLLFRLSQHLPPAEEEETSADAGLVQLARAAAFYTLAPPPSAPEASRAEAAADRSATGSGSAADRIRWAAQQAESGRQPPGVAPAHLHEAATAFRSALETAPPLLDGARGLLDAVRTWRDARPDRRASVLFSEGEPDRLRVAFRAYRIGDGRYFDDIVLDEKSPRTYRQVCQRIATITAGSSSPPSGIVVVGDSLKRDIRPANAVGCTTVYCPGDLWGRETPAEPEERPDHVVDHIDEVPSLFGLSTTPD